MPRNRPYSTGVNELKPLFTKKGSIGTTTSATARAVITFEQMYYTNGVAMYKVTNDTQVFYQIFKINYIELEGGMAFTATYPDDNQFKDGSAENAFDLYSAHEKLKKFVEKFGE